MEVRLEDNHVIFTKVSEERLHMDEVYAELQVVAERIEVLTKRKDSLSAVLQSAIEGGYQNPDQRREAALKLEQEKIEQEKKALEELDRKNIEEMMRAAKEHKLQSGSEGKE